MFDFIFCSEPGKKHKTGKGMSGSSRVKIEMNLVIYLKLWIIFRSR